MHGTDHPTDSARETVCRTLSRNVQTRTTIGREMFCQSVLQSRILQTKPRCVDPSWHSWPATYAASCPPTVLGLPSWRRRNSASSSSSACLAVLECLSVKACFESVRERALSKAFRALSFGFGTWPPQDTPLCSLQFWWLPWFYLFWSCRRLVLTRPSPISSPTGTSEGFWPQVRQLRRFLGSITSILSSCWWDRPLPLQPWLKRACTSFLWRCVTLCCFTRIRIYRVLSIAALDSGWFRCRSCFETSSSKASTSACDWIFLSKVWHGHPKDGL